VYGDLNIKMYPNPAYDMVKVESDGNFTAKLFDLWGRVIDTMESDQSELSFSVKDLSAGMYFLQIVQDNKVKGYSLNVIRH